MPIVETIERPEVTSSPEDSLIVHYCTDFERVEHLYDADYRSIDDLKQRAEELLASPAFDGVERERLVRKLSTYMHGLDAPQRAIESARRLGNSNTLAVVTGQQPGLLGGPALTLYKAAHVVRLAEELQEAGIDVVPIFWAASEDHDIDEVNRYAWLNKKNQAQHTRLRAFDSGGITPLERMDVPGFDEPEMQKLRETLGEGECLDSAIDLMQRGCGDSFGRAINRMLLKVFGERGLVVLEPRLLRSLPSYKSIIKREIERHAEHREQVDRARRRIQAEGYRSALDETPFCNFFYIYRGKRKHVLASGRTYSIDGRPDIFRKQLLQELEKHPERFSAGVRLRPIVQGACLPTLAYCGGPSEIRYHALLKELFETYEIPMPTLLPRWSFALGQSPIEGSAQELSEKLANAREHSRGASAALRETENEMRALVKSLRGNLGGLAHSLGRELDRVDGRITKALGEIRGGIRKQPFQWSGLADDEREAAQWFQPLASPQERQIHWLSLWPEWCKELTEAFETRSAFDFGTAFVRKS